MARGEQVTEPSRRLAIVRLVFFVFFVLIILRLFQLQVINHGFYMALASGQHDLYAKLIPQRGQVFVQDPLAKSKLAPAAVNRYLNLVYASPQKVPEPAAAAQALTKLLAIPESDLEYVLAKANDPWEPLKHAVSDEVAQAVVNLNMPGLYTAPEVTRYYPEGEAMAQLLGFVGYSGDRKQGQYGIEGYWEKVLAGSQGELRSEKDAAGRLILLGEQEVTPAVDGVDLVLTIDKNIQFRACTALTAAVKRHGALGGSVVIMEPATGAVRAVCNSPTFDPNKYAEVSNLAWFSDAAVSGTYEPGSVFKPITMAAALERHKVTPETTYVDTGEVKIGPEVIKNSDLKAHGQKSMTQVLEESLNTGIIYAMRQVGTREFANFVSKFGFGSLTGIELPREQPGDVKSLAQPGEIFAATASFGQGLTVTPLQLAQAFGAIANRGRLIKPYVVQEVSYADGRKQSTTPTLVRQVLTPEVATTLSAMLVSVVERGHGRRASVPGYYVAGKTGTAQVAFKDKPGYDPDKNIGTFVGFAPVDEPRFVMVVKIDQPKDVVFAESSAAPLFGELAKFLLEYYQVPPTREVK
ncbi:MAG: penicillin-binding protein 2 [Candidatus Kerfeldbacteria bacterium]|nr:penicillin-binding protein 2 [Candidatus Kerfeldbacteria bacterium]